MPLKNLLNNQINNSPEPLRSYIHDFNKAHGEVAHLIQENFMIKEQLKELQANYLPIFFLCKCGEEIEGSKDTDEHQIACPKCKRRGCVEQQAF